MRKKGIGTLRVVSKRLRRFKSGRLFAQKHFQLHSNLNDIVNYTLSSGFSDSGLIPIGGIPLFLFDLSRRMLRTA